MVSLYNNRKNGATGAKTPTNGSVQLAPEGLLEQKARRFGMSNILYISNAGEDYTQCTGGAHTFIHIEHHLYRNLVVQKKSRRCWNTIMYIMFLKHLDIWMQ